MRFAFAALLLLLPLSSTAAAFSVIYNDGPSEGFNDPASPDPQSQMDGNPGTTLGEQRRWAFERALQFWGLRLQSNITIRVDAEMNDLTCDSTSAVLGSAGAKSLYTNWIPAAGGSGPTFTDTWYGQALANRIANKDNGPSTDDIGATFNKHIDESNSCLGSITWYYALGHAPGGTVSFYRTVLHEMGHGVNFQTFVDVSTGKRVMGLDDIFMKFLEDHSLGLNWPSMSPSQRQASATDTNDLHWTGSNVLGATASLGSGTSAGHVKCYAPSSLEQGSSVSHWDKDVDDTSGNSELMEPVATGTEKLTVTDELFHDLGWNAIDAHNCSFANDRTTVSGILNGTRQDNACVSVTYNSATVNSGDTSALAGQQVIFASGFTVKMGATFTANTDPSIGL